MALAALGISWAVHAQQSSEPTFRVSSELVVIDLVAVDSRGRFITDLRPEEIEVREDGRRQQVRLLRLVGREPGGVPVQPTPPNSSAWAGTPSEAYGPAVPADRAPRHLVIVLDASSLSVDAVPRIREALLATLKDLPDGVPVMLATIGPDLVVRQPFATDRQAIAAAVSSLSAQLKAPTTASTVFDAIDRICAAAVDQQRVLQVAIETGERFVTEANARSVATSSALADLLTRLSTLEGRKHLVFYSAGHAISPLTQAVDAVAAATSGCTGVDPMVARREASGALGFLSTRDAADGLRAVIALANRAQTTFYTLDPSGITTDGVLPQSRGSSRSGSAASLVTFAQLRNDGGRDYLQGLANETGGLAVKSNDMDVVLRRAWEDAGQYYLVGFTPPSAGSKGPFRKLTLSVKRSGVDVRYRKGYLAVSNVGTTVERAVATAFANPRAYENEDVVVSALPDAGRLAIEVLIPHTSIQFTEVDGEQHAAFTVHAELRDANGRLGNDTQIPGKDIALRLTPAEYSRIRTANSLQVALTTPAPHKRTYSLTVVVRDSGGWIATRRLPCCEPTSNEGSADAAGVADVLALAAEYVDQFVGRLSNVVLEERLEQALTAPPQRLWGAGSRALSPGTTTRRRLLSEFLLVRPTGTVFWIPFRDVVEVDGRALTDRRDRLMRLFVESGASGTAQANSIAAAGAAHQLGTRPRTTTNPVIALAFLQPHHQHRFRYSLEKPKDTTSGHRVTLQFTETTRPTLMRTEEGQDLPIRGAFEIDVRTGTVLESELLLETFGERVVLRTRYVFDERLQAQIPSEMTETHQMKNGSKLESVAHYGRFRTFSVSTSEAFK